MKSMVRFKSVRMLVIGAFLVLLLASCDYFYDYVNKYWVDDVEYGTDKMVIASKQANGNGSWEIVILLMTDGVDFFPARTNGPVPLDGSGDVIRLFVNSPASSLVEGEYRWSTEFEEYTVTAGSVSINAEYDRGLVVGSDSFFRATDGIVWITETPFGEMIVDFEMNGHDQNADEYATIEGHYRGQYDLEEWTLPE